MSVAASRRVHVELGHVADLPTIATQSAAAVALGATVFEPVDCVLLGVGFSSAYAGGVTLDALDRREAIRAGAALLVTSVVAIVIDGAMHHHAVAAFAVSLALALTIAFYDAWHKYSHAAPLVMGACHALVYLCAAIAITGRVTTDAGTAAASMLAYVTGLTELARTPRFSMFALAMLLVAPFLLATLAGASHDVGALGFVVILAVITATALLRAARGDSPRATVALLAGMSLVDAVVLARFGHLALALVAAALFPVTKALQRVVRGN